MIVTDERLRQIGHSFDSLEEPEMLALAIRELALAILERVPACPPATGVAQPEPARKQVRPRGEPLGDRVPYDCPNCSSPVVDFLSAKNRPYRCDVEVSERNGARQTLTHKRWFHNCGRRG